MAPVGGQMWFTIPAGRTGQKNSSPRNNFRCRTQQAGCHSERYVVYQKHLNKCPYMCEFNQYFDILQLVAEELIQIHFLSFSDHFFRNFNNKLASYQIDSLIALIDALPHDYRSKPVDHEFVQEKQWGFWELDHKSALAPSANAKTKPAPRTLLISFRLTGNIPNGTRVTKMCFSVEPPRRFKSRTTGKPVWNALYIIEVIILGDIDVHTFPLAKRSALCTKFATALNRSLCHLSTNSVRPVPVRAKQLPAKQRPPMCRTHPGPNLFVRMDGPTNTQQSQPDAGGNVKKNNSRFRKCFVFLGFLLGRRRQKQPKFLVPKAELFKEQQKKEEKKKAGSSRTFSCVEERGRLR
ncbi:conserved hypothetical protein [Culex quinquefasciatus]|uniref:Uncharacterized protein n=1 Tax=Culex quinquefasciatus TaxID=7176 RepID=B0X7T2_CULQU|nr:conserved hypothetical protein [Culex quinquefasciatus]|eukprot:XP_001865704.1 conserved hypothetical protein [Culex quinquefasciatus]